MKNKKIVLGDELKLSITEHDTGEIETAFVHSTANHFEFKTTDVMPHNGDDVMRYQKPLDIVAAIFAGLDYVNGFDHVKETPRNQIKAGADQ